MTYCTELFDDAARPTSRTPAQDGMTLVEIMIALTIGLIVLAAVAQIFLASRSSYITAEGLARTQESGRFAMEFLTQDIRMAGFAGCHNPQQGTGTVSGSGVNTACSTSVCNLADNPNEAQNFFAEGIRGYTYVGSGGNALGDWSPALPAAFFTNGQVTAGTDVILIQYAESANLYAAGNPVDNANKKVPYPSAPLLDGDTENGELVEGDILMISDCKSADVFRLTNLSGNEAGSDRTLVHASTGNYSAHLSHVYADGAEFLRLVSRVYYVAPGSSGEPSLWRKGLAGAGAVGNAEELVQGIEDMRFLYGVDTDPAPGDGVANRYARANLVGSAVGTSWNDVVSVRLGLLIRTPSAKVEDERTTRTYEVVDGVTADPPDDYRLRQVYRSTIELRN